MAGPFSGIPIGTIGPKGVDYSPYLELQRLRQSQNQSAQQIALQQQAAEQQRREFEQKMAEQSRQFNVGTEQRGQQFATEADMQRQGLGLRAELGRGELGLKKELGQADVGLREKQYGLSERKVGADIAATEAAGVRDEKRIGLAQAAQDAEDKRFHESLGFERSKFDWRRDMDIQNQGRADYMASLDGKKLEIQQALASGEMDERTAKVALLRIEADKATEVLKEMKEQGSFKGLSAEQAAIAADYIAEGKPLPREISAQVATDPKAQRVVESLYTLARNAKALEGASAETELTKGRVEAQTLENDIVRAKIQPSTGEDGKLGEAENEALAELERKNAEGTLGEVGEVRVNILTKLKEIEGDDSDEAVTRREDLKKIAAMIGKLELEDDDALPGSLKLRPEDAAGSLGLMVRAGRAVNRLRQEAGIGEEGELRDLLDKYGLEP